MWGVFLSTGSGNHLVEKKIYRSFKRAKEVAEMLQDAHDRSIFNYGDKIDYFASSILVCE